MSAFVCSPDHIKRLAIFGTRRNPYTGEQPVMVRHYSNRYAELEQFLYKGDDDFTSWVADTLYQENIRSVRARYPHDTWESLPGPSIKPEHLTVSYAEMFRVSEVGRPTPVEILKMCDCLEYQSCETDDYQQTIAWELLSDIRGGAIRALPGYEEARWEWVAPILEPSKEAVHA